MLSLADPTKRLARWCLHSSEFDFDIVPRAAIKHRAVDTLSRLFKTAKDEKPFENELPFLAIDHVVNANTSETCVAMDKPTYDLQTLAELIRAQKNYVFCRSTNAQVGCTYNKFSINSNGLLV